MKLYPDLVPEKLHQKRQKKIPYSEMTAEQRQIEREKALEEVTLEDNDGLDYFLRKYPKFKKFKQLASSFWFDWFCDKTELGKRLNKMFPVIQKSVKILGINPENFRYYLKNIQPCVGPSYDRIGIIDKLTDEQIFIIDFPALTKSAEHNKYTINNSLNSYWEPIVAETDLSVFYEKIAKNKNEILLPLLLE